MGLCRHFSSRGLCIYGEECKFEHPKNLHALNSLNAPCCGVDLDLDTVCLYQETVFGENSNQGIIRKKLRKSGRANMFRKWLIDVFGREFLRSGNFVLEVAGGHGEISFQLENLNDIRSIVIDPRNPCNSRSIRKLLSGAYHDRCSVQSLAYIDNVQPCYRTEVRNPAHIEMFWNDSLWKGTTSDISNRILACSIVIGMHPDEATESIVDFALAYDKTFAIVPCCVFPKSFPNRFVDGRRVKTYCDFLRYLVAKDPSKIRIQRLDFEGRNIVVYRK